MEISTKVETYQFEEVGYKSPRTLVRIQVDIQNCKTTADILSSGLNFLSRGGKEHKGDEK